MLPRTPIALGGVAIYALCFVSIKAGLPFAPPSRFAGLRLLIAGLALLALVIVRREPVIPPRRILAAVFVGERITRGKIIALGLGVIGVTLIAYPALVGSGAYGIAGPVLALAVSAGSASG